jgi:ribosomal protein L18
MASENFIQAINKHVMGDRSEFTALRNRFKDFDACTGQPAAAALGYLIAKDELEAKKEEEEEEKLDVYDEAIAVFKKYGHPHSYISPHTVTDEIFTLIYKWLNKELTKALDRDSTTSIEDVNLLFQPFIIKKSE